MRDIYSCIALVGGLILLANDNGSFGPNLCGLGLLGLFSVLVRNN